MCRIKLYNNINNRNIIYIITKIQSLNVSSWRGRQSYMAGMYADKNIHIAFILVAGCGVSYAITSDESSV